MSDTQRLGVYMHSHTFDLARSAYVADLDTVPDSPDSLGAWIDAAIRTHAQLRPSDRAVLGGTLDAEIRGVRGKSRSFIIAASTVASMEAAVIADRKGGRILSRGGFVNESIRAAARRARDRLGGDLPSPPLRLPNRPPRSK